MNTVRRVAKNTIVMLIGDVIGKVLTFIFIIYAARYLKAEGYGILAFGLAFTSMFGIFSDIGFYELIVREVARDMTLASKYTGNVIVLKAIIVSAMYSIMCLAINLMGYPQQVIMVVYILGLSIVLDAFTMIFNATFQAFEKMEYISIGKLLGNTLRVFGILFVVFKDLGIIVVAVIYLLGSIVALIYSTIILIKKFTKPRIEIDVSFIKWLLKEGVGFWAIGVFAILLNNIDKVMLSTMVGNFAVGIYSAAHRITLTLVFIPIAFTASIFPITSRLFVSSHQSLKFAFERSFKYLLITGVTLALLVTILSDELILCIYGYEFKLSSSCLKILIWTNIFLFINFAFGNLLRSINKQFVITYIVAITVALNVILNLALIPRYSFIGASWATLIARFFAFTMYFAYIMRSEYRMSKECLLDILKVIFALHIAIGVSYVLKGCNPLITCIATFLIFLICILLLKIVDEYDIRLIKHFIKG